MSSLMASHRRTCGLILAAGLWALCALPAARAEDIDIFAAPTSNRDRPNVLIVLDNSANWTSDLPVPNCYYKDNGTLTSNGPKGGNGKGVEQGKKVAIEKCALYNVVDALPVDTSISDTQANARFNLGFLLLNESPFNGAYPRQAFIAATTQNKTILKSLIASLSIDADKGSNADFARALYEAFLYYKSATPYNGRKAAMSDIGGKVDVNAFDGQARYKTGASSSCARNHVILIANGSPQSTESDILDRLKELGANTTAIQYANAAKPVTKSDASNWADEMARHMASADVSTDGGQQSVTVHTVAVTGAASDNNYPNFIEGIATAGGGQYRSASNVDALVAALMDILNEIQAVNTVFAAASLPVSVNARGTYLNQVYMGMFRPDAAAKPRWRGNLKQYRFSLDVTGNLQLVDAAGQSAINSSTGFITPSAVSYWTTSSNFWQNQLLGTPPTASDHPDGEVVEKGGVAQQIRSQFASSQTERKLVTCLGCASGTLLGSNATLFHGGNSAITATALGLSGTNAASDRQSLIDWVRGTDNAGDESGPGASVTIRPSVHGDVIHSRPAIVNHGGSAGVVAYYGSNDGTLRAINGSTTGGGQELWAFIPEEMFGKLKRLRNNLPEVQLPTTPGSASARDYMVDGPIGVYQKINSSGESTKVHLYVGMRRGGRLLYALDVSTPGSPRYLWRKTASDLPALGQTWSEPKVARIKRNGDTNPVLVFGGGYDATAEDAATPGSTTMGHRIFVLDAFTGELLKEFSGMTRSVAADVALVDSDFDGYIDRAYAADLGGQIWRVDFESAGGTSDPESWSLRKVADLSGGTATGRKFFYAPDAVVTRDFTALMIGSGDREKPLTSGTRDHFFTVFDRHTGKGASDTAPITFDNLTANGAASSTLGGGCYQALAVGEKVVNAATSIGGVTYYGSNQPNPSGSNSCTANLGVARSYAQPLFCRKPESSTLIGGGLPPSPVSGIVSVESNGTTKRVPFIIGAPNAKRSAIEGNRVNPDIQAKRARVFWFSEGTP